MNEFSLREELVDAISEEIRFNLNNDSRNYNLIEVAEEAKNNTIENMIIYTSDCKDIIKVLDFDIFSDDNSFGEKAESYEHGAYIALNDIEIDLEELIEIELNK